MEAYLGFKDHSQCVFSPAATGPKKSDFVGEDAFGRAGCSTDF